MRRRLLFLLLAATSAAAEELPPFEVHRASGAILMDGQLDDPGWQDALRVDTFYETAFGDPRSPHVQTTAWLTYDSRYFYVGVRCQDPDPGKIRAPYVDRDNVFGDQDNFAIFLDTRNDRRSAQEFRVNPRGIQGDAVYTDATFNEDFSPDFYYDTAARITPEGWEAEVRIPLSSLRYPRTDPQTWGILLWRNYPRDFRYAIYSTPLPRTLTCYVCNARPLTGLSGLPSGGHLVAAPYAAAQQVSRAPEPGAALHDEPTEGQIGLDVKWTPSAETALDAAINPDFSQVEADVAQIAVNNRFALFYPEKRPFFLEGVDLFETPIQAFYTRTITDPRWGGRATGKIGSSSYTILAAEDQGGGSVILPGPTFSTLVPQDFRSFAGVARWRRDLGRSFFGLLLSDREIDGGGHNRVVGPDLEWRHGADVVSGQFLYSDTLTPDRPELTPGWDGSTLHGGGLRVAWTHRQRSLDLFARYNDFGDGFRADNGFVSQVGYRSGYAELGYNAFPAKGLFTRLRPYTFVDYQVDREGSLINQRIGPGVFFLGKRNLQGFIGGNIDRVLTSGRILSRQQVPFQIQVDPSRRFTRISLQGFLGEDIDLDNVRVGKGGDLTASAILRPTDHLDLRLDSAVRWLDVEANGREGRLFTAQVQRIKATYNFSGRMFLRLIGQYVSTRRDPSLYDFPVPARDRAFAGSALFSYRLNWQTALFAGYGDDRALAPDGDLARTQRELFIKISYAFQR